MFAIQMHHSIKMASRRTGLSQHVIRVWEKRYGAVRPERSGTNRRLYSEEEIERLRLLRLATSAGHSIGNVARLPKAELQELVAQPEENGRAHLSKGESKSGRSAAEYLEHCLRAVERTDAHRLESVLTRASVDLGHHGVLQLVAAPLTQQVGELWRRGMLTAAHEHFATGVIRGFLSAASRPYALGEHAAVLVVGTPAGQLHEMGAVIVAAAAADLGWRVVYLGTGLPAAEIAGAAVRARARAVALSIVYPEDDPGLPAELEKLRQCLPPAVSLIVGGRAASAYSEALRKAEAVVSDDLQQLCGILDRLRSSLPRR